MNVYAIFCGTKWGLCGRNRKRAVANAQHLANLHQKPATVRAMPVRAMGRDAWDAPTFRVCSELVATVNPSAS